MKTTPLTFWQKVQKYSHENYVRDYKSKGRGDWIMDWMYKKRIFEPQDHAPTPYSRSSDPSPIEKQMYVAYDLCALIATEKAKSLILCGSPGLGKTTTVKQCLDNHHLKEGFHYAISKGACTPKALYRLLWQHNDQILILDDSDGVLANKNAANILKAALDNKPEREVSWETYNSVTVESAYKPAMGSGKTTYNSNLGDLPGKFTYTGSMIFISNLLLDKFPEALRSRSYICEIEVSREQKIDFLVKILYQNRKLSQFQKGQIEKFIVQHGQKLKELSLRTLEKIIVLATEYPMNWATLAVNGL